MDIFDFLGKKVRIIDSDNIERIGFVSSCTTAEDDPDNKRSIDVVYADKSINLFYEEDIKSIDEIKQDNSKEPIFDRLIFVKLSVDNNDKSNETIHKLRLLLSDNEFIPVYKVPISTLAKAALILLGEEPDEPDNDDIRIWKENLSHKY
ncbi:hypothetical protein [Gemelliphila palaticanis]|uniref:DUF4265 domain-containing protein n=1 Tax=Gemelliphila palaticanis TaxID=81950 RepID=A0ABX2T340_9BACL|nr:hypothetical protein [Gemella palaticanis]MBF0716113.1 hypothetical protein [Gemella palaticanis]NYS48043.1 hypothetical protein [Gemella palaticanis]